MNIYTIEEFCPNYRARLKVQVLSVTVEMSLCVDVTRPKSSIVRVNVREASHETMQVIPPAVTSGFRGYSGKTLATREQNCSSNERHSLKTLGNAQRPHTQLR